MLDYLARRVLTMILTMLAISVLVFVIIQLPPGDYLTTYIAELESQGEMVDPDTGTSATEALIARVEPVDGCSRPSPPTAGSCAGYPRRGL